MGSVKSIWITNNKGGVGKTILTYCLGMILASEYNKKVLFIDVDVQESLGSILGMDVIERPECLNVPDIFNEMKKKENNNVELYIRKTINPNVDIILNDKRIDDVPGEIISMVGREKLIDKWFKKNKDYLNNYDYIFFDCDSSMQIITSNVAIAVDSILYLTSNDIESLSGIQRHLENYLIISEDIPGREDVVKGIIVNDMEDNTLMGREFVKYIKSDDYQYKPLLLKNQIHHAEAIKKLKVVKRMFPERENKRAFAELRNVLNELFEMEVL